MTSSLVTGRAGADEQISMGDRGEVNQADGQLVCARRHVVERVAAVTICHADQRFPARAQLDRHPGQRATGLVRDATRDRAAGLCPCGGGHEPRQEEHRGCHKSSSMHRSVRAPVDSLCAGRVNYQFSRSRDSDVQMVGRLDGKYIGRPSHAQHAFGSPRRSTSSMQDRGSSLSQANSPACRHDGIGILERSVNPVANASKWPSRTLMSSTSPSSPPMRT